MNAMMQMWLAVAALLAIIINGKGDLVNACYANRYWSRRFKTHTI